jgi:hypothetical protein
MVQPVEALPLVCIVPMMTRDRRDIRMQLIVVKVCADVHVSSCSMFWCLSVCLSVCLSHDDDGVAKRTNWVASTQSV